MLLLDESKWDIGKSHVKNTDSKENMTAWHQSLLELAKQNVI
jgi:hypothetical protein